MNTEYTKIDPLPLDKYSCAINPSTNSITLQIYTDALK